PSARPPPGSAARCSAPSRDPPPRPPPAGPPAARGRSTRQGWIVSSRVLLCSPVVSTRGGEECFPPRGPALRSPHSPSPSLPKGERGTKPRKETHLTVAV